MKLLTIKEAAAFLRIHEMTVYRLCKDKKIPCVKFGHTWRIIEDKLMELFK